MKNYYITFGQSHCTIDGYPMKDNWVRVVSESLSEARIKFMENFAIPIMGDAQKWAFSYSQSDFNSLYYPKGEFAVIDKELKITFND